MKTKFGNFRMSMAFIFLIGASVFFFRPFLESQALAHGCPQNEPDRDGDGVPDKDDAYPDDPTEWKNADDQPLIKIYLIPFALSSSLEATQEDIEHKSHIVLWIFDNDKAAGEFKKLILANRTAGAPLENSQIRLKVVFPKENITVFVDREGHALKNPENKYAFSKADLQKIEQKIRSFVGVIDIKQSEAMARGSQDDLSAGTPKKSDA